MTETDELLAANQAFYDAFAAADSAAMIALWAVDAPLSVIHPGSRVISGRESVFATWRMILDGQEAFDIACVSPRAQCYGETGLVLCYEQVGSQQLMASNLFMREGGAWRLVHHQAGMAIAGDETAGGNPGSLH